MRCSLLFALAQLRPSPGVRAADVLRPSDELLARGVQARVHFVHGVEVLEVVLGRVDFDARVPIVMRLHGRHSDWRLPEGSYAGIDQPYRLIVPRGVFEHAGRRSWAIPSVRSRARARLEAQVEASADRLASVLAHFRDRRRSVGMPVVAGFSQGGMVALALAARHPSAVGAVLPVAAHMVVGLRPERLAGARLPEVHALHGEADEIVSPGPARDAISRLRGLGFRASLRTFPGVGHELSGEMAEAHRALLRRALERASGASSDFGA